MLIKFILNHTRTADMHFYVAHGLCTALNLLPNGKFCFFFISIDEILSSLATNSQADQPSGKYLFELNNITSLFYTAYYFILLSLKRTAIIV